MEARRKRLNGGCFGLGIWVFLDAEAGDVLGGVRDFILFESSPIELRDPSSGVGLGGCDAFDPGPIADLDPRLGPFWPFFRVAFRLVHHQAGLGVLISNQSTGAILEFAFSPVSCFCFYELLCF
jgi:hypothetical protein